MDCLGHSFVASAEYVPYVVQRLDRDSENLFTEDAIRIAEVHGNTTGKPVTGSAAAAYTGFHRYRYWPHTERDCLCEQYHTNHHS